MVLRILPSRRFQDGQGPGTGGRGKHRCRRLRALRVRVFHYASEMLPNAAVVMTVAVRATEREAIARTSCVLRREEKILESLLVEVPKSIRHITLLDGPIRAHPYHLVAVARDTHVRPLHHPIRNRT